MTGEDACYSAGVPAELRAKWATDMLSKHRIDGYPIPSDNIPSKDHAGEALSEQETIDIVKNHWGIASL